MQSAQNAVHGAFRDRGFCLKPRSTHLSFGHPVHSRAEQEPHFLPLQFPKTDPPDIVGRLLSGLWIWISTLRSRHHPLGRGASPVGVQTEGGPTVPFGLAPD